MKVGGTEGEGDVEERHGENIGEMEWEAVHRDETM